MFAVPVVLLLAGCSSDAPPAATPEPDPVVIAYSAEGGGGDFVGAGVICDLDKPFTIEGSGVVMEFEPYTADSTDVIEDADGTYVYTGVIEGVKVWGGEAYRVVLDDDGVTPTGIFGWGVGTVSMDGIEASGYGEENYTLMAFDELPAECG